MTDMSLLDEFIGSINHLIMDFKDDGGGGDVMFEIFIVIFLNFFDSLLETKWNELV